MVLYGASYSSMFKKIFVNSEFDTTHFACSRGLRPRFSASSHQKSLSGLACCLKMSSAISQEILCALLSSFLLPTYILASVPLSVPWSVLAKE